MWVMEKLQFEIRSANSILSAFLICETYFVKPVRHLALMYLLTKQKCYQEGDSKNEKEVFLLLLRKNLGKNGNIAKEFKR